MRCVSLVLVLPLAAGCVSSKWSRETVDATGGSGRDASMQLHVEGNQKTLTIVHADPEGQSLRFARRTGSGASWGAFTTGVLDAEQGRLPATTTSPDGTVWVAYVRGSPATDVVLVVAHLAPESLRWSLEVVGPALAVEPPAIAFEPDANGPGRIHVVLSDVYRYLEHYSRALGEREWTKVLLPEILSGEDDPAPPFGPGSGVQPRLLTDGTDVRLFYLLGRDATELVQHPAFTTPLAQSTRWAVPAPSGSSMRYAVALVDPPAHERHGAVALAATSCEGKPALRFLEGAPGWSEGATGWSSAVRPPIPTDESIAFCDPSFAYDASGFLYLSCYHPLAGALVVFVLNPVTGAWNLEYADSGPSDRGRYTSTVYDPLAQEILVAYQDASAGELRLATRGAN